MDGLQGDTVLGEPPAVVLADAAVRFGKGEQSTTAVDALSLTIARGRVFCLLGPNGAGKTTTINLILGLVPTGEGTVHVFGKEPSRDRRAVLRRTAVVPQETALYEKLTGRENLEFHGQYYGVDRTELPHRIDRALEIIGLVDRQHQRVDTYSGGMRRRLAMGRTLITDSDLILLDEPTLGVDVHSRNEIWGRIKELARSGKAILLTTNYMDEADELADEILLIDRGRAVVHGTATELKARVGDAQLNLAFSGPATANKAAERLAAHPELAPELQGNSLLLRISSPERAIDTLRELPSTLGDLIDELEQFAVREPSLQDVFLHFTGRALRD